MLRGRSELVANLRHDYKAVTGAPFRHFFCPLLYRDEDVELCEAHIVNQAVADSPRATTVQRKDIDSWFGSMFEADWVLLKERGRLKLCDVLGDRTLACRLKPRLWCDGEPVEHYVTRSGDVSPEHTRIQIEGIERPLQLVLKLAPDDFLSSLDAHWEISIQMDVQLAALVSLLKAAH